MPVCAAARGMLIMADSPFANSLDEFADVDPDYRSIEPWALVGMGLGLLSPLAMLAQVMWLVPLAGVLIDWLALRRIGQNRASTGRALALTGMALSVFFLAAAMGQLVVTRQLLSRQAREVADQWFAYLREGKPEKAYMLQVIPERRPDLTGDVWPYFRHDNENKGPLRQFVDNPAIRALLDLGPRAQVRFYKTLAAESDRTTGQVMYRYTVTYEDEQHHKRTFLMHLLLERKPTAPGLCPWRVKDYSGGSKPA